MEVVGADGLEPPTLSV